MSKKRDVSVRLNKAVCHRISILLAVRNASFRELAKSIGKQYGITYLHLTGRAPMGFGELTDVCRSLRVELDELLGDQQSFAKAVHGMLDR